MIFMKYRRLSPAGDYMFGYGNTSFLIGAQAVTQAIQTKLKLFQGECWEDLNDGLPFFQSIAGNRDRAAIDLIVKARILETPNVRNIAAFNSSIENRKYSATATVNTAYGPVTVGVG